MIIYLIRHGETAGNADRIMQFPETPLNERGIEQAERMAGRLAAAGIARIVASDYLRTQMTAASLARVTALPVELNELLRERHFGELCGRPIDEIGDVYRPELAPPGGENWARFHARIDKAWRWITKIAGETEGHLAVVSHGMVCYSLALRQLLLPAEVDLQLLRFANTSVTMIERQRPWRVQLLNCSQHLDESTAHSPAAIGV